MYRYETHWYKNFRQGSKGILLGILYISILGIPCYFLLSISSGRVKYPTTIYAIIGFQAIPLILLIRAIFTRYLLYLEIYDNYISLNVRTMVAKPHTYTISKEDFRFTISRGFTRKGECYVNMLFYDKNTLKVTYHMGDERKINYDTNEFLVNLKKFTGKEHNFVRINYTLKLHPKKRVQ